MSKIKLAGTEIPLPTSGVGATNFDRAPGIRLVNTATTSATVTVLESVGGAGIGTFTILGNSTEHLAKANEHVVYASAATVLGTPVGFVG